MTKAILIALGGAAGSLCRYAVAVGMRRWITSSFPLATFTVNVVGAFAIGFAMAWLATRAAPDAARWQPLIVTGFLGGFTTYSAFALETVTLLQSRAPLLTLSYVVGTLAVAAVVCLAGLHLGRALLAS